MDNNVIEKIDEIMKQNKEFTRDMNEKLNHIRGGLAKKTEDVEEAYDRGLRDMWEVVYAIAGPTDKGGLTAGECLAIFGNRYMGDIVEHCTYRECINLYRIHNEKKVGLAKKEEKEAQRFERGDVVIVENVGGQPEGIYLSETGIYHVVLYDDSCYPQLYVKDIFTLRKTGKHIDMSLD